MRGLDPGEIECRFGRYASGYLGFARVGLRKGMWEPAKLLVDNNLSQLDAEWFRLLGDSAQHVLELGLARQDEKVPDEALLKRAKRERLVIVTENKHMVRKWESERTTKCGVLLLKRPTQKARKSGWTKANRRLVIAKVRSRLDCRPGIAVKVEFLTGAQLSQRRDPYIGTPGSAKTKVRRRRRGDLYPKTLYCVITHLPCRAEGEEPIASLSNVTEWHAAPLQNG